MKSRGLHSLNSWFTTLNLSLRYSSCGTCSDTLLWNLWAKCCINLPESISSAYYPNQFGGDLA